ncbi:MAG: efflux RND transporter periplasmic adaptor subunit [Candidatus Acidoferrales bacterium]
MHIGRTSLRLTSLLASGRRRRKLRTDLKVNRQVIAGEATYVIKVPQTSIYLRLPELEWEILNLFDGTRTDREVWEDLQRREPELEMSLPEVEDYADTCDPNLWERTLTERNLALLEKIRSERQERASEQSIFYMYFSAWDPNNFFARVNPYLRWIYTPHFVFASLILFFFGIVLFVADFDRIMADTWKFYSFTDKSLAEFVDFWILLFVVGFIHECAHGLTCKSFGGDVHQMGFLLIYFTPAFYTDVSDMYLFDKDYKRQWTIFAGIWIEGIIFAFSLIVWVFTGPGTFVNEWAYKFLLMTSITGLALNLNPLMKFDGYYALSQVLKIDNLREDSFDYLKQWAGHYLSGGRVPMERVGRRKHRIFLIYASLAFLYTVLVLAVVLLWVKNVTTSKLGFWGWVLTAWLIWLVLRRHIVGVAGFLKHRIEESKEVVMHWRQSWRTQAVAGVGVLLLFVPWYPFKVTADFILEPGTRAEVRASASGSIQEVRVREGQRVEHGDVLAVLHNAEIEARARILELQLRLAEQAVRAAQARGDFAQTRRQARERQRLWKEWQETRQKEDHLRLRAPIGGLVTTPQIDQRVDEYLSEGQFFCTLVNRETMRARVLVRDAELEDIQLDAPVKLKVRSLPLETFAGRVEQILPAAAEDRPVGRSEKPVRQGLELFNYFAVILEFPNPEGQLREGMTGTAKIYGRRHALAWSAARTLWRWARSQVWN